MTDTPDSIFDFTTFDERQTIVMFMYAQIGGKTVLIVAAEDAVHKISTILPLRDAKFLQHGLERRVGTILIQGSGNTGLEFEHTPACDDGYYEASGKISVVTDRARVSIDISDRRAENLLSFLEQVQDLEVA